MKKTIVSILMAAMVMGLAACGDKAEQADVNAEVAVQESTEPVRESMNPTLSAKTEGEEESMEESAEESTEAPSEEEAGTEEEPAVAEEPSAEEPEGSAIDWNDPEIWKTVVVYRDYEGEPEFKATAAYIAYMYLRSNDPELVRETCDYMSDEEFDEYMKTYEPMSMKSTIVSGTAAFINFCTHREPDWKIPGGGLNVIDEEAAEILYEFEKLPLEEMREYTPMLKELMKECNTEIRALREAWEAENPDD